MDKYYFFYVLYCQDHTLYAGYTDDLQRRLRAHNEGKGAKYTRVSSRRPVQMIYAERWSSKSLAMKQEYQFKQLSRKQKEAYLLKRGVSINYQQPLIIVNRAKDEEVPDANTIKFSS